MKPPVVFLFLIQHQQAFPPVVSPLPGRVCPGCFNFIWARMMQKTAFSRVQSKFVIGEYQTMVGGSMLVKFSRGLHLCIRRRGYNNITLHFNSSETEKLSGTSYILSVSSGLTGQFCEINIDDCEEKPCGILSICKDALSGYSCFCAPGFIGK